MCVLYRVSTLFAVGERLPEKAKEAAANPRADAIAHERRRGRFDQAVTQKKTTGTLLVTPVECDVGRRLHHHPSHIAVAWTEGR